MEGKQIKSIVLFCFVLGLLIGQSTAQFQLCYGACFIACMVQPPHNLLKCGFSCLKKCILPAPLDMQSNPHHFCKLGCATSLCTNISTEYNPNEEKVKTCVDSCTGSCANVYALTKN